jgi:hypothetical protein
LLTATSTSVTRTLVEGLIWPFCILPSVAVERMTIEGLTLALMVAAAAECAERSSPQEELEATSPEQRGHWIPMLRLRAGWPVGFIE